MTKPKIPKNEAERLDSLHSHNFDSIYNSDEFNFLTELASQISGCEISLISLIYEEKQWFLSHHGLSVRETPRNYSFCAHAIIEPNEIFIVENALSDSRFTDNPLVTGEPNIRFYSGIPLLDDRGLPLGTLCVIDKETRRLNEQQILSLKKIANQVQKLFELRRLRLEEQRRLSLLEINNTLYESAQELNRIGAWQMNLDDYNILWTDMLYDIYDADPGYQPRFDEAVKVYHPDDLPEIIKATQNCIENGVPYSLDCRIFNKKGKLSWIRTTAKRKGNLLLGSVQDITAQKEREIKFESIINASTSILVILDKEGRINELNDTATSLVNMQRSDFLGKYFWDANYWNIGSNYIDDLKKKFDKALLGVETSEEMIIWLNGEIPFTVQFIVRPVYNLHQEILFVLVEAMPIQDIVDERNNNRFIIEGANVATGSWDYVTDDLHFDERWYAMLGYTSSELHPMTLEKWMSFYHPDDLPKCQEMLDRVFSKELEFYDFEARLKHKNGHWIWVEDKGKVLHWSNEGKPLTMYGIHQDVTHRKERELRIAYQENILKALFRNSPVGIVLTDFETSLYLEVNQAFEDLVGYEINELKSMTYVDITPPEYTEREFEITLQLKEKRHYKSFHKNYIKKDGSLVSVIIQGVLIQDTEGRELVWTFVQDITKERESQDEIRNLLELTQDQNQRLNNFARIVSHNLKNHSDGILGVLELLREQNPELAANKYLNLFEKSAKNLVQTISYLSEEKLLLSKLGSITFEKVDFTGLIKKNMESFTSEFMKNNFSIEYNVKFDIVVKGVQAYLDSIVLNLISNAIKYRNRKTSSILSISHLHSDDYEIFEFADNGLGIDLDKHGSDIFGLYKTFHENNDSRGIGLFISKNQIEQMGGKIEVESELNKGTTFRLFLLKH